jgi:signal transduction histidine kinase
MITKKIIDEHKGQIIAESKVGVGSTFVIRIPKGLQNSGVKIPNNKSQIPNKSQ